MRQHHLQMIILVLLGWAVMLSGMEWRISGIYKTKRNAYRDSKFNPRGMMVRQLDLAKTEFHGSQFISARIALLSFDWSIDILANTIYRLDWKTKFCTKRLCLQRSIFQNGEIMIGRALLHWGTGYVLNPTNVVAPPKELGDPENTEKRVTGKDLVKLEYFNERSSVAVCYVTELNHRWKWSGPDSKLALRYYQNIGCLDLSLILRFRRNERPLRGANFSYVPGERLEIHGEITSQKECYHSCLSAAIDETSVDSHLSLQMSNVINRRFCQQYLLGVNFTGLKKINWILEYFHQDRGYTRTEWEKIIGFIDMQTLHLNTPWHKVAMDNLRMSLKAFSLSGAMRDYLMNYIDIPLFNKMEIKAISFINLNDRSRVIIPEFDFFIKNSFTFFCRSYIFTGGETTEYGAFFQSYSVEGGVRCNR